MRKVLVLMLLATASACKQSSKTDTAPLSADAEMAVQVHMPSDEDPLGVARPRAAGWPQRASTVDDCVVVAGDRSDFRVIAKGVVTPYTKDKAREALSALRATNRNTRIVIVPEFEPGNPLQTDGAIDEVLHEARMLPIAHSVAHVSDFVGGRVRSLTHEAQVQRAKDVCAALYAKADECALVALDATTVRLVTQHQLTARQPREDLAAALAAHPEVKRIIVAMTGLAGHDLGDAYNEALRVARLAHRDIGDFTETALAMPPAEDPEILLVQAQNACFDSQVDRALVCPAGAVSYGNETVATMAHLVTACTAAAKSAPDSLVSTVLKECAADPACTKSCAKAYAQDSQPGAPVPACADARSIAKVMPQASRNDVLQCHLAGWFASAAQHLPTSDVNVERDCRAATETAYLAPQVADAWTAEFGGAPFLDGI